MSTCFVFAPSYLHNWRDEDEEGQVQRSQGEREVTALGPGYVSKFGIGLPGMVLFCLGSLQTYLKKRVHKLHCRGGVVSKGASFLNKVPPFRRLRGTDSRKPNELEGSSAPRESFTQRGRRGIMHRP